MENLITSQSDDRIDQFRLIARSLMLLALLTAILYIRVFAATTLSTMTAGDQAGIGLLSFLFLITAIAGLILTWRWEGLGGLIVTLSGIGLAVVTYFISTASAWFTAFFYSSPFIITGVLYLICWHRIRNKKTAGKSI